MKKGLFILSQLSDSDIEWMLIKGNSEEIPAGTILIREGQEIDALYVVLDGTLKVYVAALSGREIAKIGYGEVLGEISFVDTRFPAATVKAVENTLVLSIPRPLLIQRLQQDVEFASRFYRAIAVFLASRLRDTVTQLGYDEVHAIDSPSSLDEFNSETGDNRALAGTRIDELLQRSRRNN